MSQQTHEAVTQALRDHLADEMPEYPMLTDWYVVLAGVGAEVDVTSYLHINSNAPSHSLAGLLHIGIRRMDAYHDDDYGRDE